MGKMTALLLACMITGLLAACQTAKGNFCAIAEPMRPSPERIDQLSEAEVKALLAHNRKGARLCRWKP